MIDWQSKDNVVLLNPRIPADEQKRIRSLLLSTVPVDSSVILATSGTTGAPRWAVLPKEAFLFSAEAVNRHLNATKEDRWLHALPTFHVGGLGIEARTIASRCKVSRLSGRWNPGRFCDMLERDHCTISALVPAQVYDLVQGGFVAPPFLRAVIIGGGRLNARLQIKATRLGWPLIASYGMTEYASQIATATLTEPLTLQPLDHVRLKIDEDGVLWIAGQSLLQGYLTIDEDRVSWSDPLQSGWFCTNDRCEILDDRLIVHGRRGDFIKIGGESVNLASLQETLQMLIDDGKIAGDHALIAVPCDRLGHVVHLVSNSESGSELAEIFNAKVMPFERIRRVQHVKAIPRSSLGKVQHRRICRDVDTA
ncbi:MAG: AMP-binding protein [Chlamydiales bacterium]|nr:AMP-binding protein [Chlamydiales bacterium]